MTAAASVGDEAVVWVVLLTGRGDAHDVARRRAAARAALDRAVASHTPTAQVVHRPGRRPEVLGAQLFASLAHAESVALVAVSPRVEIGVDLEPYRAPPPSAVVAQLVTERELAALSVLSAGELGAAFARAWVRKEAALKAVGRGLAIDPSTVEVGIDEGRTRLVVPSGGVQVTVVDLDVPGHAAACALVGATRPVVRVRRVPGAAPHRVSLAGVR